MLLGEAAHFSGDTPLQAAGCIFVHGTTFGSLVGSGCERVVSSCSRFFIALLNSSKSILTGVFHARLKVAIASRLGFCLTDALEC